MTDALPIVYIVDDDAAVRRSLEWLVTSVGLTARPLGSAKEFLDAFDAGRPGCLVLDLRMPDMSGLELQEQLTARGFEVPTIMITAYGEVPAAVRAMRAGAVDFVQKPFSDHALLERIQEAAARARQLHRERSSQADLTGRLQQLSRREAQVMYGLAEGLANKQIAARLGLSEKTVEVYRSRMLKKLGVRTVAELVRIALRAPAVGVFPAKPNGKP